MSLAGRTRPTRDVGGISPYITNSIQVGPIWRDVLKSFFSTKIHLLHWIRVAKQTITICSNRNLTTNSHSNWRETRNIGWLNDRLIGPGNNGDGRTWCDLHSQNVDEMMLLTAVALVNSKSCWRLRYIYIYIMFQIYRNVKLIITNHSVRGSRLFDNFIFETQMLCKHRKRHTKMDGTCGIAILIHAWRRIKLHLQRLWSGKFTANQHCVYKNQLLSSITVRVLDIQMVYWRILMAGFSWHKGPPVLILNNMDRQIRSGSNFRNVSHGIWIIWCR